MFVFLHNKIERNENSEKKFIVTFLVSILLFIFTCFSGASSIDNLINDEISSNRAEFEKIEQDLEMSDNITSDKQYNYDAAYKLYELSGDLINDYNKSSNC